MDDGIRLDWRQVWECLHRQREGGLLGMATRFDINHRSPRCSAAAPSGIRSRSCTTKLLVRLARAQASHCIPYPVVRRASSARWAKLVRLASDTLIASHLGLGQHESESKINATLPSARPSPKLISFGCRSRLVAHATDRRLLLSFSSLSLPCCFSTAFSRYQSWQRMEVRRMDGADEMEAAGMRRLLGGGREGGRASEPCFLAAI